MWLEVEQLNNKTVWQDFLLALWSSEAFKDNTYLDSLLLLFDGLWNVKAQYMVFEEKHNKVSGNSLIMKLYARSRLPEVVSQLTARGFISVKIICIW